MSIDAAQSALEEEGFVWFRKVLDEKDLSALELDIETCTDNQRLKPGSDIIKRLKACSQLTDIIQSLGYIPSPVRLVTFNKTAGANWSLPWHQDRVVAVNHHLETRGVTNWSKKAGVWHCEPPLSVLQKMIFVRIHLDPVFEDSGGLEIAPGTHKHGYVEADRARAYAEAASPISCLADRGDVLILKALVLHRSTASKRLHPRRAFRIDYASTDLPAGLEWAF